jgi:hypothetical protein
LTGKVAVELNMIHPGCSRRAPSLWDAAARCRVEDVHPLVVPIADPQLTLVGVRPMPWLGHVPLDGPRSTPSIRPAELLPRSLVADLNPSRSFTFDTAFHPRSP